ncbi:MAG: hypothetical protein FJY76_03710 [Candidatus Aenigmarchaeota archaeon]|nr:hypothetical protein [Candidatus Aenigmarchaeota archaeon]
MKAGSNLVPLAVFGFLAGIMALTLLLPKVAEPSLSVYGNQQAYVTAKMLASEINALSYSESGEIEKTLETEWDISIKCATQTSCEIKVWHDSYSSEKMGKIDVMGRVKDFSGTNVKRMVITKTENKPVEIKKVV